MSREIAPKPDWRNLFCPECHNVRRLPYGADETAPPPWCLHHGGDYSWHAPHPSNEYGWTPMVFLEDVLRDTVLRTLDGMASADGVIQADPATATDAILAVLAVEGGVR